MDAPSDYAAPFVAKAASADEWQMFLFEQGPWKDVTRELLRFQERLYDCVDTVLDGHVAAKFPQTKGARIIVRVDCCDLPRREVADFFRRFTNGIFRDGDYRTALERREYVSDIAFAINFDHMH